jgi:two-component system LytT family sensor kinase
LKALGLVIRSMAPTAYAILVNLLGFITGVVLYGMLLVMVLRASRDAYAFGSGDNGPQPPSDRLPLITAILGLTWNVIACAAYGLPGLRLDKSFPILLAVAFSALGFLPAVVVHSVLRNAASVLKRKSTGLITGAAYCLSGITSLLHFISAIRQNEAPSQSALLALTMGFVVLIVALLVLTRREAGWRRAIWVVALSLFAVSALHLSHHVGQDYPWWIELVGHHASLPLVLAILYQDYRFALADLFLKRALALLLLVAVAFGLYAAFASHALFVKDTSPDGDTRRVALLLSLWIATALLYPVLRRAVEQFVDRLVLRRADYNELKVQIARLVMMEEDTGSTLDMVCERLAVALTAREVRWFTSGDFDDYCSREAGDRLLFARSVSNPPVGKLTVGPDAPASIHLFRDLRALSDSRSSWSRPIAATGGVLIPAADPPQYFLVIGELAGGRRLMSDDIAMIESIAILVARGIDRIRVTHERCERDLREQQVSKLATEAELRALRAQINPHFLFNALTTIGYLIQTAPDRALDALMRLTGLLRGALQRSAGEFATLGQEMDLIEAYLDIERARFEERLRVKIDVPFSERAIRVPSLLVQPLVENAVKHGIGPCRAGGVITVAARRASATLYISVQDTGAGVDEVSLAGGRKLGVGLANVEQRLRCHYGDAASLTITSELGTGTLVEIRIPVVSVNQGLEGAEIAAATANTPRDQRRMTGGL